MCSLQSIFGDIHKQRIVTSSFITIETVNILRMGNANVLHTNKPKKKSEHGVVSFNSMTSAGKEQRVCSM
jgi:hypothetical protein